MPSNTVPLDPRALAALKHSALALDVYSWLSHRLHRVRGQNGAKLSWANLREQFGQEYRDPKDFKREMTKALGAVVAVYPDAGVERVPGGLTLLPSKPPVTEDERSDRATGTLGRSRVRRITARRLCPSFDGRHDGHRDAALW